LVWRRFDQLDLDEQAIGSSFGFSSRRFERRASAALADLRALGFAWYYYGFHVFDA
jgi:hypothetical protein